MHRIGIHHPRHGLLVGADVRRRNIALGPQPIGELCGVTTGHAFKFAPGLLRGSQMMPPLAPPNGMSTTAHFHVIQAERARTSSMLTSGANRMPPLPGPRTVECSTR